MTEFERALLERLDKQNEHLADIYNMLEMINGNGETFMISLCRGLEPLENLSEIPTVIQFKK